MVTFRDPIHGDLSFTGVLEELILTDEFQRLSEVKQLGLTEKVYPGANHTRFSHALGVCFIMGEICRRLKVPDSDRELLQIGALLHDIGHYDFSHAIEGLAPCDHEENGKRLILGQVALPGRRIGEIAAVLAKHNIDPSKIIQLLHHQGDFPKFYYTLLSGKIIDADRMDYLRRDTYYSGAVIGTIDVSRLLNMLVVHPQTGELGISHKGVASLEQFMVARAHMYQQVYLHRDSAAAEAMLRKAVQDSMQVAQPLLYGDGHLLARLAEQGTPLTKRLIALLRSGRKSFYRRALVIDAVGSAKHLVQRFTGKPIAVEELELAISKKAGLPHGSVLIAVSTRKSQIAIPSFPVLLENGQWEEFFELSPVARSAYLEPATKTVLAVICAEQEESVRKAALEILEAT
jgi:uncharacterized protein